MQTIKLDKLIKLFDSPGIVMSKENNPANLVLRNCVRVSQRISISLSYFRFRLKQLKIQYQLSNYYFIDVRKNK